MAITSTTTGVLGVDDIYKKTLSNYIASDPYAGSLYGWGNNFTGENLPPINNGKSSPTQIPGTTWTRLAGKSDSFAAVKCDNTMWYWGTTAHGSRMENTSGSTSRSSPVQMPGTEWCNLARSQANHFGIKTDGTLWSVGYGYYGINGDNTNIPRSSPVQLPGRTWCSIRHFSTGALALKNDNTLWSWGENNSGQLGLDLASGTLVSSPTQIPGTWCAISQSHASHGIKTDGTLWAWGSASRLGNNATVAQSSPVQVPGTTWCYVGNYEDGAFAIKTDGTLWGWGSNSSGQLGVSDTVSRSSPIQIPGTTWKRVCGANGNIHGLKTDGTFWGWGTNTQGGLGLNDNIPRSSPVQLPGTWCNFHSVMETNTLAIKRN